MTGKATALIGVSEKGYATMRVTTIAQAGHSSMPPAVTAVTMLGEALRRINDLPVKMSLADGPGQEMIRALGDEIPLTTRMAAANEWLFSPLIRQQLGASPAAAAMMRTTIAATMLEGSPKENIIPGRASALINFRLHPRDKAADVLAMAKAAVADLSVKAAPGGVDQQVTVEWNSPPNEASPVSSTQSDSYALLAAVARGAAPDAPVTPSLVLGATDSRLYVDVAENTYRFAPMILDAPDIECIHGQNERLSIENLDRMIRGYMRLIATGAE
jgi:carboxypeptidase PM20D1